MKILQISNKIPYPPSDGGAIAILSLALGIVDLGHELTLLSMNTLKHHYKVEDIPNEFTSKIRFVTVDVPAKISPLGLLQNYLFSDKPYTATRFISEDFSLRLIELFKEDKYDIVQLEGLYLAPYIDLIRQYSDAKIVMRAHNVEHEIWERVKENTNHQLKKIYLRNLNKKLKKFELSFLNDYDLLLPITARDGEQFRSLGYQKDIYTLVTGIDTSRYKLKSDLCEYPSLFHLGSLDWEPNIEGLRWFLTEVWPMVLKKQTHLKFYIAGRNASESTIKYLQSFNNVIYDGEVSDANAYMNSKSIMIVPLLSGSGMRIKILEGLALSKVIVSTSIGVEGISIKDGLEMMIADSPKIFAEKILYLVQNPRKYKAMSVAALNFIQKEFDNHTIVAKLMNRYEKLINEKL